VTRPLAALLGLSLLAPAASASLERQNVLGPTPIEHRPVLAKRVAARPRPAVEAQVTEESEVYLDGRRCEFKDVPDGSVIEKLVLGGDGKTALRIEFHRPK
jgi:hypothetical protein